MKNLIVYFSRADENYFGGQLKYIQKGNTQIAAEKLRDLTGADLFEIKMKEPYAAGYKECVAQAKRDKEEDARPQLVDFPESMEPYDVIYLGYPNYCGTIPMPVFTFLEHFDFTGKKICPFCTNEGSGMGKSESDIKKYAPHAILKSGLAVIGSQAENSQKAIEAWLGNNGLK